MATEYGRNISLFSFRSFDIVLVYWDDLYFQSKNRFSFNVIQFSHSDEVKWRYDSTASELD